MSHGSEGSVRLGNIWLTSATLGGYAGRVSGWQEALASNADLLFYGCDLAGNANGQELIASLGALTGADVAASVDDTGHTQYGGDWDLEFATGVIETPIAFGADVQQNWVGKLAVINVTQTADVVNGNISSVATLIGGGGDGGDGISLREAILAVNNGLGGDTIQLAAGTYTLSGPVTNEHAAADGDLDILKDVTIIGADARTTIIDATGLGERVFHLKDFSLVTMSGITIQGGDQNNGGGIFVDNSSTLYLSDAFLTSNTSDRGGAIHVHGTAHLNRVLLYNNSAVNPGPGQGEGGAIHFHNADGGSLTNVTISGNSAEDDGGGLWTDSSIAVTNSTITANSAWAGGGIYNFGGTVDISNTIVAGNFATNSHKDAWGSFNSDGFNLIEVTSGSTGFGNDITGVSANLGALSDNGGQTDTHALLAGSFAINTGGNQGAPGTDQAGSGRDAIPDIGAWESTVGGGSKLYWVDSQDNVIYRSNTDGSAVQAIISGLDEPRGIAVDIAGGKVYWSEAPTLGSETVKRANLDGTDIETLFDDTSDGLQGPQGIDLDLVNAHIYFADADLGLILRGNLDGTGALTVVANASESPSGVAVDPVGGWVYWSDRGDAAGEYIKRTAIDLSTEELLYSGLDGPVGPRS